MQNLLSLILSRKSYPLNKIYISKSVLEQNYQHLSSINPQIQIAPVLKSNAYGHGIELVGKVLAQLKTSQHPEGRNSDEGSIPFICVDSLFEAYQLKKTGVKTPILIMGCMDERSVAGKRLPFEFAVFDLDFAKALNKHQPGSEVHIFVDTGMHREGVQIKCKVQSEKCKVGANNCLVHFVQELKKLSDIKIVGLMSHLAIGNESKNPLTIRQLREFGEAIKICEQAGLKLKWKHLGGSNAILHLNLADCGVNLVRCGLGIYGIDPTSSVIPSPADGGVEGSLANASTSNKFRDSSPSAQNDRTLKPVLKLITKIVQIKKISKGEKTGYGAKFRAKKDMKIGILPLGYSDGVDRRLSNLGSVLVGGVECPIIGLLSMNMTTVDLSKVNNPKVGDEVIVFSDNPQAINSIQNSAKLCQTTPYVLLINLASSTRREVG